jgi:hypothetical protein
MPPRDKDLVYDPSSMMCSKSSSNSSCYASGRLKTDVGISAPGYVRRRMREASEMARNGRILRGRGCEVDLDVCLFSLLAGDAHANKF